MVYPTTANSEQAVRAIQNSKQREMEAVAVSALLNILVPKLMDVYNTRQNLRKGLAAEIQEIKNGLESLNCKIQDNYDRGTRMNRERELWISEVHKLAQDTEDCIDRYLHPAVRERESLEDFAGKIERLKTRARDKVANNPWPPPGQEAAAREEESDQDPYHGSSEPVGMEEPITRILELLGVLQPGGEVGSPLVQPAGEDRPKKPKRKVISIVGFVGLGKTRLARKVYSHIDVHQQFPLRVWVRAAGNGSLQVLQAICKELEKNGASTSTDIQLADLRGQSTLSELGQHIESRLRGEKYCIVIDDIRATGLWTLINSAFPKDVDGRIIVTTTMLPVANSCSAMNGYVYKMPTLSTRMAENLFFRDYQRPTNMSDGLARLLKKCDGLPLALMCVLAYLESKENPMVFQEETCKEACRNFRTCVITDDTLERMRNVLVKKYNGLPNPGVKACLLYFYLFPDDNPISEGSLTRQCLAEGFLKEKALDRLQVVIAEDYLKTLVEHNIIQPIQVSNMGFLKQRVRKCRPHGIMLEYITYKAISGNFITLLCGQNETRQGVEPENVRRLSLHHGAAHNENCIEDVPLPLLRTLTVSGKACDAIMDFSKYELLRVLDLKKCDYQLTERHLDDISIKLLLLKYLSLGNANLKQSTLPRAIGRLPLLETLEMKKEKVPVGLPQDVIKLPRLKHLIGKFRLVDTPDKQLEEYLSKKSILETFSGFVTGENRGFARLMSHMKRLRKVKIWYDSNADPDNLNDLSEAIKKFRTLEGTDMARSLSIDLDVYSEVVLNCLQEEMTLCSVVCLKFSGDLASFVPHVQLRHLIGLVFIKELCLSMTKLRGDAILSALSNLGALKDLTLVEQDLGLVVLRPDILKGLERICLVSKTPLEIIIKAKALPLLLSFHMICEALGGPADIQIGCLASLQEIALSRLVHPDIINLWKEAAQQHHMRPNVLLVVSKFLKDQDTPNETVPSDTATIAVETIPSGRSPIPVETAPSVTSVVPVETAPIPTVIRKRSTGKKVRSSIAKIMKCFICGQRGSGTIE